MKREVSIVIPCHNAARYLGQAMGSALEQSRQAREIIVVDDQSSDDSLAIARRFESAEPGRVRVFAERFGHASRARNLGALAARGDALMFLDADDVLGPDAIGSLASGLESGDAGIALCPWARLERIDGRWVERPPSCRPRRPGEDPLDAWLAGWYHPPCSVLWSREAFDAAGRWDEQAAVNQDGDLVMRALVLDVRLNEVEGLGAYYRRPPDGEVSLSGTRRTPAALRSRLRTLEKIGWMLEDRGRLEPHRLALQEAVGQLADDAAASEIALRERVRALGRRFGLSRAARAGRVARQALRFVRPPLLRGGREARRRPSPGYEGATVKDRAREVRWGLDRAEAVFAASEGARRRTGEVSAPMSRPSVTVIIPTFNRSGPLARALASVRAQTFADFEVVVVDDGSTDDTAAVVAACADPRVRFLRQARNAGASAARNRGLREARAPLIAFLDSDDEWFPRKLERQVAVFEGAPDRLGLVYTGVQTVREDGTCTTERPEARGDVYREMLWRNAVHGGGSNVMIRRAVIAAAGFFREDMRAIEDYEYWLRISRFFHVDFVDEPLIRYHDPRGAERRSQALQTNLEARWWLYRTHGAEMRRAGVAHLFLIKTIRWALPLGGDAAAMRRLAARAVLEAPASRMALATFLRTVLPPAGRVPWVRRHGALE